MDLSDLRAHVGDELWAKACRWAWGTAAGIYTVDDSWPDEVEGVPHDLEDVFMRMAAEGTSSAELVSLRFELYRAMPSYAHLMYLLWEYREFSRTDPEAHRIFWSGYRSLVSDHDDRLSDPVAYSLVVDYFEDPETVEESWWGLLDSDLSDRGLERVLVVSGPVPWRLKAPLYEQLIADDRWHPFIFASLRESARVESFGDIDPEDASLVLGQLRLPQNTEGLGELERKLATLRLKRRLERRRAREDSA